MKKPIKNPYLKNTEEHKIWNQGYNHGLMYSKNKTHVDCPIQVKTAKEIQLIWDSGFVAGRKVQKPIPKDTPYCYTPLSGIEKDSNGKLFMKTKTCPYYGKRYPKDKEKSSIGAMGFCRLTRDIDDILLSDQCKICGIKTGEYNE